MNKSSFLLAIAIIVSVLIAGCGRDPDPVSTLSGSSLTRSEAFAAYNHLKQTPQVFTVTAGTYQRIVGKDSTVITFYANSFKDASGNIINSGDVKIELSEYYTAADMIANRMPTVTANGLLTTSGSINIRATVNGEIVDANKYGIAFKAIPSAEGPMELFYGNNSNEDSTVVWEPTKPDTGTMSWEPRFIYDTSLSYLASTPYYIFDSCTVFTMVNCDHPHNDNSKYVKLTFNVGSDFRTLYSSCFINSPTENIVTSLSQRFSTSDEMMSFFQGYAPVGPECNIVLMIPITGGNFRYFRQKTILTEEMTITPTFETVSPDELAMRLKAL